MVEIKNTESDLIKEDLKMPPEPKGATPFHEQYLGTSEDHQKLHFPTIGKIFRKCRSHHIKQFKQTETYKKRDYSPEKLREQCRWNCQVHQCANLPICWDWENHFLNQIMLVRIQRMQEGNL